MTPTQGGFADVCCVLTGQSQKAEGVELGIVPAELPAVPPGEGVQDQASDLWLYRDRTVGMLRRFLRLSIEVGRLPSLLGREFFRTRVTSYRVSTFEDAVIFVHDVEHVLELLGEFDKKLIAKIVFQDHSHDEAARLLNCGRRTVTRRFPDLIDEISESFLRGGLLVRLPATKANSSKPCQEGKTSEKELSD